jgi:hypothetical protein
VSRHGSAWRGYWRSKDKQHVRVKAVKRQPPFQISVRPSTRDAIRDRARALGVTSSSLASRLINAALDKAGAP